MRRRFKVASQEGGRAGDPGTLTGNASRSYGSYSLRRPSAPACAIASGGPKHYKHRDFPEGTVPYVEARHGGGSIDFRLGCLRYDGQHQKRTTRTGESRDRSLLRNR